MAEKYSGKRARSAVLAAVVFDLAILFVYKYLGFFEENIKQLFGIKFDFPTFVLPIGISFYTFQAISYVIDV
jgi:D-alanyl-lipoteichoic acid acyltransferase DltB (MBOAT superfamily)